MEAESGKGSGGGISRGDFLKLLTVFALATTTQAACRKLGIDIDEGVDQAKPTETALAPLQTTTEIAPGVESVESIAKVAELEILTEVGVIAEMDAVFGDSRASETLIRFKNGEFLGAVKDSEFFKTENINTEIIGIKVKDAERKQDNVFLFIESTSPDEEGKGFMSYVVRDPATGLMGAASLERAEGLDGKAAMAILSNPLTKEKLSEPFIIFQTLVTLEQLNALSELPEEEREKILDGLEMYFMVGLDVMSEANRIEGDLGFKDYLTTYREPFPELTEEMQEMGLQVKQDEDGRTIAVDERGYMRFYENEDGEWVDWYRELIDGATKDFWDEWGETDDSGIRGLKRISMYPVWTGEVEETSMALDGVNVSMRNIVCVITDPVNPGIIREVLVPIKIALPSGEVLEAPGMFFSGDDFFSSAEEVLNKLSSGDQFEIDIFTRAPYSDSWCTLTRKCGPPIMLNQLQGLTDLFTQIFDENDSLQWPEELIIPAFNIKFYK